MERFGQGLLTVHEQLTVSRHYGDAKVRQTSAFSTRFLFSDYKIVGR